MRIGVTSAAVPLLVAGVLLSGCEQTQVIGVLNRCDRPVEVDAVSSAQVADDAPHWTSLDPGDRADVRNLPADADSAYLMVRRPGAEHSRDSTVSLSDLPAPPDDADGEADVEIEVSGGRCPR